VSFWGGGTTGGRSVVDTGRRIRSERVNPREVVSPVGEGLPMWHSSN